MINPLDLSGRTNEPKAQKHLGLCLNSLGCSSDFQLPPPDLYPGLFCLCLMLWGYKALEKLLERLHVNCAYLQTRTQLIAGCFGSSYLQDSPWEQQRTQQRREQSTAETGCRDTELFLSPLSHPGSSCLWNTVQEIS